MSETNGVLVALRDLRAGERTTGRIKMMAAPIDACVRTERQRQFRTPPVAAIGRGFLQRAAQLATVEPLGIDAWPNQQIEGLMGTQLRRSRAGPMGEAQALEEHPGHGFAWRDPLLRIGHETSVKPLNQPSVRDHRRHHAHVLETLHAHLFHGTILP